jgi:hypothetical protein
MSVGFDIDADPTSTASAIDSALGATSFGDGTSDQSGDSGDDTTFDPERHIGPDRVNADGTFRRKRKRKGDRSTTPRAKTKADLSASIDALTQTLFIVHAGLATTAKIPELAIEQDEAKALAVSLADVLAQFDITPDPKIQAIVGLVVAFSGVYGPKVYFYKERKKKERRERERQKEQQIVPLFPDAPLQS